MDIYGVVFDDDQANLNLAVRILKRRYRVHGFSQVEDGVSLLKDAAFIVSDYDMPGMSGAGLVQMIRQGELTVPTLIVSGYDSIQPEAGDLEELGVGFLHKPYHPEDLLAQVARMVSKLEPNSMVLTTESNSKVPTTQPNSKVPTTESSSKGPTTQPNSKVPTTEPNSFVSTPPLETRGARSPESSARR